MAFNRTYYFNIVSDSNITYRLEMYDDAATSNFFDVEGTLSSEAFTIKYGSDGNKVFSPLKPSNLTLDFIVTDNLASSYINTLKDREEREVYIALYRENVTGTNNPQYAPVWTGFLLLDLGGEPDIARPYPVTLKFIDGLASLKYYDFIPTTTTQRDDHLYERKDTFISDSQNSGGVYDPYRTFIDLISICMGYAGCATTSTGITMNPQIRTAARWYNSDHANTTDDPLAKTRVKPDIYYTEKEVPEVAGIDKLRYEPKNCYEVLKSICKGWGMRVFLWKNIWYFVQLNEWRNNETGNNASLNNMACQTYSLGGVLATPNQTNIGTYWAKYWIVVDNSNVFNPNTNNVKNYKRAGGQYSQLPALKKVIINFFSVSNYNRFTAFPAPPTSSAPTGSFPQFYHTWNSLGSFYFDGINDKDFFQRIILNFSNNSIYTFDVATMWGLYARPMGTGSNTANADPIANGYTMAYFIDHQNGPPGEWKGQSNWWSDPTEFITGDPFPYYVPMYDSYNVPPGATSVNLLTDSVYSSNANVYNAQYSYVNCPASVFTAGDWEFTYYVKQYFYNATTLSYYYDSHMYCYNWSTGISGSSPHTYGVSYTNPPPGQGALSSQFTAIQNGAIGVESITNTISQTGSNTEVLKYGATDFGDTGDTTAKGGLQVYDGSAWVNTDLGGTWGIDTLGGSNSFTKQLGDDIMNAQGDGLKTFAVSTTFNPAESVFYSDGYANRPEYPFPGSKFYTPTDIPSGTLAATWIMHTGEWNPKIDTWKWKLYEQENFNITTTNTTTGNGGRNSGVIGGPNISVPTGGAVPIAPPRLANPTLALERRVSTLGTRQLEPVATINATQGIDLSAGISQTITSLTVVEMPTAIFKAGDIIALQAQASSWLATGPESSFERGTDTLGKNSPIIFEVASDQSAGATSISVTSKTIYRSILVGDTISFSTQDMIAQYQNKTKGTIGGMRVTATGLDGAGSLGRNIVNFRVEGDSLSGGTYYVLNGEDNNRSGRFQPSNGSAPTSIGTQRSFKSMKFLADSACTIESGRAVVTGTSGWSVNLDLYKATPVDGSTSTQAMTLIGRYTLPLDGDAKTQVVSMEAGTTNAIAAGDIIVPHIYSAGESGTFNFRGGITFTLVRE